MTEFVRGIRTPLRDRGNGVREDRVEQGRTIVAATGVEQFYGVQTGDGDPVSQLLDDVEEPDCHVTSSDPRDGQFAGSASAA
jgi:hypothetical protein